MRFFMIGFECRRIVYLVIRKMMMVKVVEILGVII